MYHGVNIKGSPMQYNQPDYTVYVLVRNDLPSLNSGKAQAQVHHAGTQMMSKYQDHDMVKDYVNWGISQGADHFNTTIVLAANLDQIRDVNLKCAFLDKDRVISDQIIDPSYPFFVENTEIAGLIPQDDVTRVVHHMPDGRVCMVRPEITCAWYLGDRNNSEFTSLFDGLELHA
jgi:hypothetical protein